jgi:gluconolactonase
MKHTYALPVLLIGLAFSCTSSKEAKTLGSIEKINPALDAIVTGDPKAEILGEGFKWSEGPLWIEESKMLLFTDVPNNIIHKWTEEKGVEVYLTPSGYTGSVPRGGEPGANGLTRDDEGSLVLCQHGDRRIALMQAPIDSPKAEFVTIADKYDGKRFSSPNDAVFRNYNFYFTDPPYGLADESQKELPYQGVYVATADGKVKLLVDSLTRPNGIAFVDNTLIVANSDPEKAIWYAFDLVGDDSVTNARIFYDATAASKAGEPGLPDGLKVDSNGNVFATGPGGVWIFNKGGEVLGKVKLPEPTANCALTPDGKTLFTTTKMYLLRVKLRE